LLPLRFYGAAQKQQVHGGLTTALFDMQDGPKNKWPHWEIRA